MRARKLIVRAAEAGANAAKFQSFNARRIVCPQGFYPLGEKESPQASCEKSVYEIYKDACVSYSWTARFK